MKDIAQETAFIASDIADEFLQYGIYGAITLLIIVLLIIKAWRRK